MNKRIELIFAGIYTICCIIAIVSYTQQNLPEIAVLWLGFGVFNILITYRKIELYKIKEEKHKELLRKAKDGEKIDWDVFYCKYL